MTECSSIQKSLGWCEGKANYAGLRRRLYYISKNDIVKFPVLSIGQAKYTGNFELAADKKFLFFDILPDKSQLTSAPQGEAPSQTQLNKLVAVHAGTGEEASAAAFYFNNNQSIFLVPNIDGKYRVVGSELWQVKATVDQDCGQGAAGAASTTVTVEASDYCPAPFYVGKIETEDGDFMGDGSPVAPVE